MAEMSQCSKHEGAIYYEQKKCPVCEAEQDARDAVTLLLGAEATVETLWRCLVGWDDMVCEMVEAVRAPTAFRAKEIILRVHEARDAVRARKADVLAVALGVGEE